MSSTNRLELERLRFGASRGCWGDARARWRGSEAVTERRRIRWGQGLSYCQVSPRCAISTWEREGAWRRTVARGFFRRRCEGCVFSEEDVVESTGKARWRVFVAAVGALSKWDGWRGQTAQRRMLSGTLYCDNTRQYEAARTNACEIYNLTITAACTGYGLQIYFPEVAASVWCPRRPPPFMDTLG